MAIRAKWKRQEMKIKTALFHAAQPPFLADDSFYVEEVAALVFHHWLYFRVDLVLLGWTSTRDY